MSAGPCWSSSQSSLAFGSLVELDTLVVVLHKLQYIMHSDSHRLHDGQAQEHFQQQTVTTQMNHRMPQEIISSCGNQTLQLIYLTQRDGQQRYGVLRWHHSSRHISSVVLCISILLSGPLSPCGLLSLQLWLVSMDLMCNDGTLRYCGIITYTYLFLWIHIYSYVPVLIHTL